MIYCRMVFLRFTAGGRFLLLSLLLSFLAGITRTEQSAQAAPVRSAQQDKELLREDFETVGSSPRRSALNDIDHPGGLEGNVVVSGEPGRSGSHALHWLRKDTGYYYARPQTPIASSTGRFTITYRVNFERTNPYWWMFSLIDPTYKIEYLHLFSGLGYQGNALYAQVGKLMYRNSDGSWRPLCAIQTGWRQIKIVVDFNAATASVYYGDMRVPVASDVPLSQRPPAPSAPFRPMFSGYTSANEGGFWLDDVLIQDQPAQAVASRRKAAATGDFALSEGGLHVQVSRQTGALTELRAAGKSLLAGSDDTYALENRQTSVFARESRDRVQSSRVEGARLTLSCANPDLRGIVIRKTYALDAGGEMAKRVEFVGEGAEGFLTYRMNWLLDRAFADDALPLGFGFLQGLPPGEYTSLRNTPCLIRKDYSQGLGLYRARVNDRFVLPDVTTSGGAEAWECPVFEDYAARGTPISGEMRCFVFAGDAQAYEQHLSRAPEYRALYRAQQPAWLETLASDAMTTAIGILDYVKAAAPLPVSSTIWFLNPPWGNWWSYSDPPLHRDAHVRDIAFGFRGVVPNARISAYANETFDRNSDVFKTHPEFGVTAKDGHITDTGIPSDAEQAPTYYVQIRDKAARDYYLSMYVERVKNWKLDFLYLDGPGSLHEMPDWKLKTVVQSYDWLDFYRELKERLTQQSPQAALWSNGFLPYSDVGYVEWRDPSWQEAVAGASWRYYAFSLWLLKQRQMPGYLIVPLYGDAGAQPAISSYSIAYGWGGEGATIGYLPWQIAALEYRGLQVAPNALASPWYRDGGSVEAYGFRKGENALVNVISHSDAPRARLALNTRALGLEQGETVLLRVLTMNMPTAATDKNANSKNANAARAFTTREMRRITVDGAQMSLEVPAQKGMLTTVIFSKALALAENNGPKRSETGLTETYAAQLKTVKRARQAGEQAEYAVTCKYADTVLFFPFASRAAVGGGAIAGEAASVDGVAGMRVRIPRAGTYAFTVQSSR